MKKRIAALAAAGALVFSLGIFGCGSDEAKVVSGSNGDKPAAEEKADQDVSNLKVGATVEMDGLQVTVKKVKTGLKNYDGGKIVCVTVAYENTSDSEKSFNVYDWKAEDKNGAQRSEAYYSEAKNQLNSGELAAGGKVSGNIYFDAPVKKIVYEGISLISDDKATWVL